MTAGQRWSAQPGHGLLSLESRNSLTFICIGDAPRNAREKKIMTLGFASSGGRLRDALAGRTKVAIVTGASSGIGLEMVKKLIEKGYRVVANSRNITSAMTLPSTADLKLVDGDIGAEETAKRVVSTAIQNFGTVDLLVNNAGIFIPKPFTEYTGEDFRRVPERRIDHSAAKLPQDTLFSMRQLAYAKMSWPFRMMAGSDLCSFPPHATEKIGIFLCGGFRR
jgi:hypothetical protein